MPISPTPNETAAVLDGHGDLGLVLATTASSHGKDNENGYIRLLAAPRKPLV